MILAEVKRRLDQEFMRRVEEESEKKALTKLEQKGKDRVAELVKESM